MSIKQTVSDRVLEELYDLMASPRFMRLSHPLWRLTNEWQRSRFGPAADARVIEARIESLERTAARIEAKLTALEEKMAGSPASPSRDGEPGLRGDLDALERGFDRLDGRTAALEEKIEGLPEPKPTPRARPDANPYPRAPARPRARISGGKPPSPSRTTRRGPIS